MDGIEGGSRLTDVRGVDYVVCIRPLVVVPEAREGRVSELNGQSSRSGTTEYRENGEKGGWETRGIGIGKSGIPVPVKGQIVPRLNLDGVRHGLVAHDVAAHVDRVEVLDGRVGVAIRRRAVVGRGPDPLERALVDAIDEDTLLGAEGWLAAPRGEASSMMRRMGMGLGCSPRCSSARWRARRLRLQQQLRGWLKTSFFLFFLLSTSD